MPRRSNRIIDCGDYCKIELYYPHSNSVCDYALISKSDLILAKLIYWRKTEYGYARGKNPLTRKDIFLHKYITQTSKETVIDHINRNKLDCRRENMRIADSQINSLIAMCHAIPPLDIKVFRLIIEQESLKPM